MQIYSRTITKTPEQLKNYLRR